MGASNWYDRSIIDQLGDIGIKQRDIDFAAYSYFHYDHVGTANAFSDATLLIQESEYYAAFHDAVNNPIFRVHLYTELAGSTTLLL